MPYTDMKNRITKYKNELSKVEDFIQQDLVKYFKKVNYNNPANEIQIIKINNEADLKNALYGAGFYIILTDHIFEDNSCKFELNGQKAIYRGHSYFTKKRLLSHLANEKYKEERKSSDPNYTVCMKIEDNVNGINIDQAPYKNWNWTVIVHNMINSTKTIREQAELAFDVVYNKPCKSRE